MPHCSALNWILGLSAYNASPTGCTVFESDTELHEIQQLLRSRSGNNKSGVCIADGVTELNVSLSCMVYSQLHHQATCM